MPTQTAYKDLHHTAITTWSGFIYQGKVALYHALRLLENQEECNEYKLQLDYLEDFAILDAQSAPVSLHQVKARKTPYYNEYQNAIANVKKKAADENCDKAFFHTAMQITDKTPADIASDEAPVKLYEYDGKPYCGVDEIDRQIEKQLKKLWSGLGHKEDDGYIKTSRLYFDEIILKQVLHIHGIVHADTESDRAAACNRPIEFSKFIDLINHPDLREINKGPKYWLYILLNDIHRYYLEYCYNEEDSFEDDEAEKLEAYINELSRLDEEELLKFIKSLTPDRKGTLNSLSDYKDEIFNKHEFQRAFLRILRELKKTEMDDRSLLRWQIENTSFSPTAINSGAESIKDVCRDIINTFQSGDFEVLYEASTLITTSIDTLSITEEVTDVISTEGMGGTENDEHNILELKKVALISLNEAKGKIND